MKRKCPVVDMERTGQNIKRIMKLKKLSVREIQEFLGLSAPQAIYHWFDGRNLPTLDNLYALSELFNLPLDALVVGNREYPKSRQNQFFFRIFLYHDRLYG